MARDFVRVLAWGDMHCGHKIGLTHPDFNPVYRKRDGKDYELSQKRAQLWKLVTGQVEDLKPIDILIDVGDVIDGKGEKSGGTELITADRNEQVKIAIANMEMVKASEVYMCYGSAYHTGIGEDYEDLVASGIKAVKIGGHDYLEVRGPHRSEPGVVFDYRHFVSRSIIPHGRGTPLARAWLNGLLWAEHGEYPKGDIFLRGHVHYLHIVGGYGWRAIALPALQAAGSKHGTRTSEGPVDFGFLVFDVYGKGEYTWKEYIWKLRTARANLLVALSGKESFPSP